MGAESGQYEVHAKSRPASEAETSSHTDFLLISNSRLIWFFSNDHLPISHPILGGRVSNDVGMQSQSPDLE